MVKLNSSAAPILALGLAGLVSGLLACTPVQKPEGPPWRADHHMHLGSVDIC